jgi:uncharacterized protein (TIGR02001 family)
MNTTRLTCLAATVAAILPCTSVLAEVSANVGFASEYYYRGILQKDSSASAGIDLEEGGFYVGGWTADVGDGLEVDGYLGYGIETDSELSVSLGLTGYYYTGEFDNTYEEINLNLEYGPASLEYSVGTWDGVGRDVDYDFLAITIEHNGLYGKYGTFGDGFDGDYLEFGYGTEIGGFDIGIATIFSSDELSDQLDSSGAPTESEAIVLTVGKTFSF